MGTHGAGRQKVRFRSVLTVKGGRRKKKIYFLFFWYQNRCKISSTVPVPSRCYWIAIIIKELRGCIIEFTTFPFSSETLNCSKIS